jgi:hypothetical protein
MVFWMPGVRVLRPRWTTACPLLLNLLHERTGQQNLARVDILLRGVCCVAAATMRGLNKAPERCDPQSGRNAGFKHVGTDHSVSVRTTRCQRRAVAHAIDRVGFDEFSSVRTVPDVVRCPDAKLRDAPCVYESRLWQVDQDIDRPTGAPHLGDHPVPARGRVEAVLAPSRQHRPPPIRPRVKSRMSLISLPIRPTLRSISPGALEIAELNFPRLRCRHGICLGSGPSSCLT